MKSSKCVMPSPPPPPSHLSGTRLLHRMLLSGSDPIQWRGFVPGRGTDFDRISLRRRNFPARFTLNFCNVGPEGLGLKLGPDSRLVEMVTGLLPLELVMLFLP